MKFLTDREIIDQLALRVWSHKDHEKNISSDYEFIIALKEKVLEIEQECESASDVNGADNYTEVNKLAADIAVTAIRFVINCQRYDEKGRKAALYAMD